MRILIINVDYGAFLSRHYENIPGLAERSYDEQMRARNESLFGVADFYSHNLRVLGHEAWEVHANNEPMQRTWAREHGVEVRPGGSRLQFRMRRGIVPWVARVQDRRWMYDVLAAQIRHYRPDVILNQVLDGIDPEFLRGFRGDVDLLVGQVAAPLADERGLDAYDLIISSLPNFVERFRKMGIAAELNRFAFDARVLHSVYAPARDVPVSFVGSMSRHHGGRAALLEHLAAHVPLALWGKGGDTLGAESTLGRLHHGEAWGNRMYEILGRSRITLNHHIEIAGGYANNMRLFEGTGMGALLVTDWKENLAEIFEPGAEVVAYRSPQECAEMVRWYLEHDNERAAIAHAGQQRTLRDHNYVRRMEELETILVEARTRRGGRR